MTQLVNLLSSQFQVKTGGLRHDLEEQQRTQSSNSEAISRKMDEELTALYTQMGEMVTSFVAQWEEQDNGFNDM